MGRITVTVEEHQEDIIDDVREESDSDSTAAAVRTCIDAYAEMQKECERQRERIDGLEDELERVRREKRLILEDRDEKDELVEYVENERHAEQQWRQAGLLKKAKWSVFGMP